jgi:hypothetical protein
MYKEWKTLEASRRFSKENLKAGEALAGRKRYLDDVKMTLNSLGLGYREGKR